MEYKTCTKCTRSLPATTEYFYQQKQKNKKQGEFITLTTWCKECRRCYQRGHKEENKEYYAIKRKEYYEKNKEYEREYHKVWYRENREEQRLYHIGYRNSPSGKAVLERLREKYKDRKHKISDEEWLECKEFFNFKCAYCGIDEEIHKESYGMQFAKEHVIHQGRNDIKNCVPSCKSCNSEKHIFTLNNWYNPTNVKYTYERYKTICDWFKLKIGIKSV
jgi:hypothetical protein